MHVNEKVFVFVIRINEIGSVTNLDIVKKVTFQISFNYIYYINKTSLLVFLCCKSSLRAPRYV